MNEKTDAEQQVMLDEQKENLVPAQKKKKRARKQVEDSAPAPAQAGGAS